MANAQKLFSTFPDIDQLLPHEAPMVMLDGLVAVSDKGATCEAFVGSDNLYFDATQQHIPAWIGLEMMAQAVAAKAGYRSWLEGLPPSQGMLLGTRRYTTYCTGFKQGSRLEVLVSEQADLGEMVRYSGKISCNGKLLAECGMNLFIQQPLSDTN
ncbi:hypothetical protein [Thaumasiovibrio subtropicus]|uniref:ApeP family dehydratase n=1 Tax=Thaumasiovibrio subtropicus TaxID=1891207 RepID=UPI000B35CC6E|nr:hypothetical protein [Thaumasiovibrio subtropicus]